MKKIYKILFLCLMFLSFVSCASTAVSQEKTSNKNNKQNEEKLRFDDWKYKGFGKELPYWAGTAAENEDMLKKLVPELNSAKTVVVLRGFGENSDQAEQSAKNLLVEKLLEDDSLQLFDSTWVRQDINYVSTEMPYISMYILYK